MKEKRKYWLIALGAAVVMAAASALMLPADAQAPNAQASAAEEKLREGSELLQTLNYTRCGRAAVGNGQIRRRHRQLVLAPPHLRLLPVPHLHRKR